MTDPTRVTTLVSALKEKFRDKYGAKDMKKYYSKFDVAVVVALS